MRAGEGKTYLLSKMIPHQRIRTGNTLTSGGHKTHYAKDF